MKLHAVSVTRPDEAGYPGPRAEEFDPLQEFAAEFPAESAYAAAAPAAGPQDSGGLSAADAAPVRASGISLSAAFLLIAAVLALMAGGIAALQFQARPFFAPASPAVVAQGGRLMLETRPAGAEVEIDGQLRGVTPLALELAVGTHAVTLRRDKAERTMSVTMTAGAQMTQYLELTGPDAAAAALGHLTVVTEPPGARVSIDGEARGVSPVTIRDLEARRHTVAVAGATGSGERAVDIEAGGTTSVVFALGRPIVNAGWLSVEAAFAVQIAQGADIVGSSAAPRVMLPAGRHEMTFSSAELGFEDRRQVDIRPDATTTVRLEATAPLNINARPWADVAVDGVALGQTPIANQPVQLGSHVVIFRHPDLGERRQTVVVTARGPNRISMDLTR